MAMLEVQIFIVSGPCQHPIAHDSGVHPEEKSPSFLMGLQRDNPFLLEEPCKMD